MRGGFSFTSTFLAGDALVQQHLTGSGPAHLLTSSGDGWGVVWENGLTGQTGPMACREWSVGQGFPTPKDGGGSLGPSLSPCLGLTYTPRAFKLKRAAGFELLSAWGIFFTTEQLAPLWLSPKEQKEHLRAVLSHSLRLDKVQGKFHFIFHFLRPHFFYF